MARREIIVTSRRETTPESGNLVGAASYYGRMALKRRLIVTGRVT